MKYAIDETELVRLERLKEDSDNNRKVYGGDTIATVWYQREAANSVPALVAEVRRLREERAAMLSDMDAVKTKAEPCDDCWTIYMLMREMGIKEKNWFHRDVCARLTEMQNAEKENAALREKVEAWEWWDEVRTYDPWSEHPYCTACGNRSKRGKIFDCAVDEYEKIKSTAREAVHVDRE